MCVYSEFQHFIDNQNIKIKNQWYINVRKKNQIIKYYKSQQKNYAII